MENERYRYNKDGKGKGKEEEKGGNRNIPEPKIRQDKNYTNGEFDSKFFSTSKSEANLRHSEDKAGFTINTGLNDIESQF
ncbi:hypothetical protein PoB_000743800, partial [Plakobranchus ocellatus]